MRKRLLFIEQNFDGTVGGSHYCLLYLIRHLDKKWYEPIVVFYENNALIDSFSKECKVIVFKMPKYLRAANLVYRKLINAVMYVSFLMRCVLILFKLDIDLVHLNNTVAVGYDTWLVACALTRIPCITHERNFYRFKGLGLGKLFRVMSRKYSKVLAVSDVIRNNLLSQGFCPKLVETIHDGIDAEKFRARIKKSREAVCSELCIPAGGFIIGMIGNVREWKGQEALVDSLNVIHSDLEEFTCLIVGDIAKNTKSDAVFMDRLVRKVRSYGLTEKVIFTGYRSDVPDLINSFDVQVNASIAPDPFPHVILEGMALGKPIIATNLGGAVESVANGITGYLIPPNAPSEIADRIRLLLRNRSLREDMARNALKRVKMFSMEENVRHTEDIYRAILTNPKRCNVKAWRATTTMTEQRPNSGGGVPKYHHRSHGIR